MIITNDQLTQILPNNPNFADWTDILNAELAQFSIDTTNRIAAFLSQAAHESADFTRLHENLNYGAQGLLTTWPSHFNNQNVANYARQPEKIANRTYANRMGNGDEESGDGWKFKGRGLFQLTGRDNYTICSNDLFGDDRLVTNPELVEDLTTAVKTACWFWNKNNLNSLADLGDVKGITKRINGGFVGLDNRLARYAIALNILGE